MKRLAIFLVLINLLHASAWADWDEELEAREAAQRRAEQDAAAKRQAETQAMKAAALRQALGKEAEGKSDREVLRLYEERNKQLERSANEQKEKSLEMMRALQKQEAATRAQRDATLKSMTGKSLQELENMSDDEADAFGEAAAKSMTGKSLQELENMSDDEEEELARELGKKYGK